MPKHTKFKPDETAKKIESCGVNPNTKRAQPQCEKIFLDFVKTKIENHEVIFTNSSMMEEMLIEFFDTYRLNNDKLPSRSTLDVTKSHLGGMIKRVTKNQFDIKNEVMFPQFARLWKAKVLELKRNGRGDKKHVPPIPDNVLAKIFEFLTVLTKLMEVDETDPSYEELIAKLPSSYRENYSKLVLHGAIFVFVYFVSFFATFPFYGRLDS